MEERQVLVKTIKKSFTSKIKAGVTWFKFISAINDLKLTKRELELLSFINYRGTISSSSSREEFCRVFGSSPATVSNLSAKLLRSKILVKEKSKTMITPSLRVDFDKDFVVRFFINTVDQGVFGHKIENQENAS